MEKFSLKAFSSATQEDSIKFGWKAVRQALLSKAGFRVPEGFLLYVKDWNSIGEAYTQARQCNYALVGGGRRRHADLCGRV